MAASTNVFDFVLKLLANPTLAKSFLADLDDPIRSVDVDDVIDAIGQVSALWGTSGLSPITTPAFLPGATAGSVLDTFVTGYYATNPDANSVWADGRVTQAFADPDGVAVAAGKHVHDVTAATDGSVAVGGKAHKAGIAADHSVAAGDDVRFHNTDDITIGDHDVRIDGSGNTVIGGDQTNVSGTDNNVAGDGSTIQDADTGGINAGANAVRESNVAGKNQAIVTGTGDAFSNDGNNALGDESVATNLNVANVNNDGAITDGALGASPQAAGEDSNLVSDADVVNIHQNPAFGASSAGTGWDADGSGAASNQDSDIAPITISDNDVVAAGYDDSRAVGDNSLLATGIASNVSQDNDSFTNTQFGQGGDGGSVGIGGAGGGAVTNSGPQSNSVDSNASTGSANLVTDDSSIAADDASAASGHSGSGGAGGDATGTGSAGAGGSGGSANSSLAASGGSEQANAASVAVDHSNVAVSYGGDAALSNGHGDIAQGDSIQADDHVYDDDANTSYTDSYNHDAVHTEGDKSPAILADDHADADHAHIHIH